MAFEKDATVDTITLVKPMGMNVHERKIKREKKVYIIATLKNDKVGYNLSLCIRSEKRNSSRPRQTKYYLHSSTSDLQFKKLSHLVK